MSLEEKAKRYEEAVKNLGKINMKTRVDYTHSIAERNFDSKVTQIEENLEKDIQSEEKMKEIKKVNGIINKIFGS
jgi:hypothetical protein